MRGGMCKRFEPYPQGGMSSRPCAGIGCLTQKSRPRNGSASSPTLVRGDNVKSTVYAISTALDPSALPQDDTQLPTAYYNSSYLEVPKARPHTFIKSINFAHDNVKAEVTVWRQSRGFSPIPRKLCRLAVGCSPMF